MIHSNESSSPDFTLGKSSAYTGMGSLFGTLVKERLKSQKISQRAFATVAKMSQANLNKVLNGTHGAPPPPTGAMLQLWAGALGLVGDERQRFMDLAALAHLPPEVRGKFEHWYDEHQKLRADYVDLLSEVRALKRAAEQ